MTGQEHLPVSEAAVGETVRRVTRVAAYALCVRDGAILLSRIAQGATVSSDGMWTLPGGGLEFGEHPRDAALRELTEETGLIGQLCELADVDGFVDRIVDPRDGVVTDFHAVRILYRVAIVGGSLRPEIGGSSDRCAWVATTEAACLPLVELATRGLTLTR